MVELVSIETLGRVSVEMVQLASLDRIRQADVEIKMLLCVN